MPSRSLILLLSAGSIFTLGHSAQAQETDCTDPFFQREINRCAALHFEKADAALALIYQDALVRLRAQDEDLKDVDPRLVGAENGLRNAQAAWIRYRDAHCEVMAVPSRGGSMEPMVISACKADLTEVRTRQLKDMLDELG